MQSKADGPTYFTLDLFLASQTHHLLQALAFSGVKYEHLKQLNITDGGRRKSDFKEGADSIDALGATKHWSSDGLYSHLEMLQDLVPNTVSAYRTGVSP